MCVQPAYAQTEDFNIRVLVGEDTTPPTTPTLLSVIPVATTQIDIAWSLATDNYAVSGYAISRDGLPIATTTLLSYSDSGLSASTTYLYAVRAFDTSINYSSSSNSLSTTTFDVPPVPVSPVDPVQVSSTGGTAARIVTKEFAINAGVSTTSLHLKTSFPVRLEVRWGRTDSYELGYVVKSVYARDHEISLAELEPGTTYEYEVIGYTPHGSPSVIKSGEFITLEVNEQKVPVNVARFLAYQSGNDVDLSWQLPAEGEVSHVRIVRSHLGFPEHPQDGAIVYQGLGIKMRDIDVLSQYSPVYYTAFVFDIFGNVSSGAVTIIYDEPVQTEGVEERLPAKDIPVGIGGELEVVTEATSSIVLDRVTVDMKMPQSSDILITQGGVSWSMFDTDIAIDSNRSFMVSVPSNTVAGNLKSIIVSLVDPTDNRKNYSFLLRINKDQTAYEATISSLMVVGRSQVVLEIFDYEAFVVATYQTPIMFTDRSENYTEKVVFPDVLFDRTTVFGFVFFILIILLIIFWLIYRRRGEDNE